MRYTRPARIFHWLSAAILLFMLPFGFFMEDITLEGISRGDLYQLHKALGVSVLALLVLRLSYKMSQKPLALPGATSRLQGILARGVHVLLYLCMLAMPLSGWFMSSAAGYTTSWFGLVELPMLMEKNKYAAHVFNDIHGILAWIMTGLIGVHIAAALYHHFIQKDGLLKRMW